MYRLRSKTLGVIGFGNIAKTVISKAKVFGLNVLVYSPRATTDAIEQHAAQKVSFQELLKESDYITIHAPLTQDTKHMFSHNEFRTMKSTAYLINTARGGIVDTHALAAALQNGEIAGAGLDVLETEPPEHDETLLSLENVVITPHTAFISQESILDLQTTAATAVAQVLAGQFPDSIVNPSVLERPNLRAKSLIKS